MFLFSLACALLIVSASLLEKNKRVGWVAVVDDRTLRGQRTDVVSATRDVLLFDRRAGLINATDKFVAIAVSEETGQISYIKNGGFEMFKDTHDLIEKIKKDLA